MQTISEALRWLILFSLALTFATFAPALTLDVPRLPVSGFADGETSGEAVITSAAQRDMQMFRLELSFEATPSNNVQIAFGNDNRPADGLLTAEESALIIGWDSGVWFLQPSGLQERYDYTPATAPTARRRTLQMAIRVNAEGRAKTVTLRDDAGVFAFPDLPLEPMPDWIELSSWNTMRVTVRGIDVADESVKARFMRDGAIIMLR